MGRSTMVRPALKKIGKLMRNEIGIEGKQNETMAADSGCFHHDACPGGRVGGSGI